MKDNGYRTLIRRVKIRRVEMKKEDKLIIRDMIIAFLFGLFSGLANMFLSYTIDEHIPEAVKDTSIIICMIIFLGLFTILTIVRTNEEVKNEIRKLSKNDGI